MYTSISQITFQAYSYNYKLQAYKIAIEMKQDFKRGSNKHQDISPEWFNKKY